MRRLLIPLLAAGAIMAAGSVPALAATTTAVASESPAAVAARSVSGAAGAVPDSSPWHWVHKSTWPTYSECNYWAQSYSPLETKCLEYTEGDYFVWYLWVLEPLY